MPVSVVDIREMQDKPGAPAYPASAYTLHKDDWNLLRDALTSGEAGIFTKGVKLGSEGLDFTTTAPIRMGHASALIFLDGGEDDKVVGSLSDDGYLSMEILRANTSMRFAGGCVLVLEGDREEHRPAESRSHDYVMLGDAQVEDLDLDDTGDLFALRILSGTFQSDALGHGFAFRNGGGVAQLYMDDDGVLVLRDVVDPSARPWTYDNERQVVTGLVGAELVADVVGVDGIDAEPIETSPRVIQVGLLAAGINADRLNVGSGTEQVNVDDLWVRGGGSGDIATLVTVSERALIADHEDRIAALEADIVTRISSLRTAAGEFIVPTPAGYVQLGNSTNFIFDKTGPNTLRGVANGGGGGGGGGGIESIIYGDGLGSTGPLANPTIYVKTGDGVVIAGDEVAADFGTGNAEVARGDHLHDGVYALAAHTHTGVYVPAGGAYADLSASSKIGTGAGKVAAGDDPRFHTQGTDTGTTALLFHLRTGFVGVAPANGDVAGIAVERGTAADARIYFEEVADKWVAGLEGSEAAIILEGDGRLTNPRAPTAHALGSHSGTLGGSAVVIAYPPSFYVPADTGLEAHLAGIDAALFDLSAATVQTPQMFTSAALSANVISGQYILGNGVSGVKAAHDGAIGVIVVQAQLALAVASSILVWVHNFTKATHVIANIAAGDIYSRAAVALACDEDDEIGIEIHGVTGAPAAGIVTVQAFLT